MSKWRRMGRPRKGDDEGRLDEFIGVKISKEMNDKLQIRAIANDEQISEVVRCALGEYLGMEGGEKNEHGTTD